MLLINTILGLLSLGILYNYFWGGSQVGFFGALQLITPLILVVHFIFIVLWILKRTKWAVISLFILVLSYLSFDGFFKLGLNENTSTTNDKLSLMSYNAMGFNRFEWIEIPEAGDSILAFIRTKSPDILCIQEHHLIHDEALGHYDFKMETPYEDKRSKQAIFSKYPIVGQGFLNLPKSVNNILFADILLANDTIRVYNVHLQSFGIVPDQTDISSQESTRLYQRVITTLTKQREQALLLRNHMLKSPYKVLVLGDFNNTQFSRVYRIIAEGMSDSFKTIGKGWGSTYSLKGIPMRIDYIMADSNFEFLSHQNFKKGYSDHEPIIATLGLKANQ